MTPDPIQIYEQRVAAGTLAPDAGQALAVAELGRLHADILAAKSAPKARLSRLFSRPSGPPQVRGVYLWGGVGRGKSMLMDLFFDTLPPGGRRRVHFHAFMADVHDRLADARATETKDPIAVVAAALTDGLQVLCFDELQITDITDAMIVGRLFDHMFDAGVTMVTTSNRPPQDLYKDGLNRKLFLPFIDLICARLVVHELSGPTDHRQSALNASTRYLTPLGPETAARMDAFWRDLGGAEPAPLVLKNKGRLVRVPAYSNGIGRASFDDLCAQPLGPSDFLMIADAVSVLMLTDIPVMDRSRNNEARRFVTLIDALYEAQKPLIASAAAAPEALYIDGAGAFEFARTASRLAEMRQEGWGGG